MTVSSEQRGGLSRVVSRLRVLFEDDYAAVLEGTYGIHVSGRRAGEIEDPDALSLSAHELAARAELVGVVEYLRGEGLDAVEAVERMLREATFTTVNRLLAVRVAEAIEVLPPSLVEGRNSSGFVETLEVFPLLRDADGSGGYWSYLQVCGDELSHAVPRLFDRRHPLSVLEPAPETLDGVVELLADADVGGVWVEAEALGWSYQFFNTQEERRKMRDESQAPRDSRELAVRNQFFTPSYVVDFLVENTLGRRLRESGSHLDLPLFLGEVDRDAPPLVLDEVSVLDPAVGSGHFLLGAYDLLERAWQEQGVPADVAAPRILGSLFGVDIDARASQVAQAVLYLRARRSAPDGPLEPPQIVTARGLPKDRRVWAEVLADVPALVRDVVEGLGEVLELAPVLGSLLKPEEYLAEAIGERLETPRLGDEAFGSYEDVEAMVLDAADRIASEAASSPAERLFAADASDALRFVEIMTRRYDTVLMNPPFGAPAEGTKAHLRAQYESGHSDVYAAFVDRGKMLSVRQGLVGALTSRAALLRITLEAWRREILLPSLVCLLDLGLGVLLDAMVEVAAYVVAADRVETPIVFRSLIKTVDKEESLRSRDLVARFSVRRQEFECLPGAPLSYWVDSGVRRLFTDLPAVEGSAADVRVGLQTSDDFRFLRAWYEVDSKIGGRWSLLSKGGEARPWIANVHLVVDYEDRGRRMIETERSVIRNPGYYFRPGVTWPYRSRVFTAQPLPAGAIFGHTGSSMFPRGHTELGTLLGWASSTPVRMLVSLMGEREHYPRMMPGVIGRLPWPGGMEALADTASSLATVAIEEDTSNETSLRFAALDYHKDPSHERKEAMRAIDRTVLDAYGSAALDDWVRESGSEFELSIGDSSDPPMAASDCLSYVVGSAFGRWNVRVGKNPDLARPLGDPFDPLPVCPPGMLTGDDGLPLDEAPVDYPISLPPDRVLVDDPGHEWDIVSQMEEVAEFLFDDPDRELREALSHLKAKDLRSYLRSKFFSQHLKRYSKSRRKAPIYWYLAVPSKQWGLWVYAPWLSREQLFAVARAAQDKMRRLADEASQLRRDVAAGGGRADRERLEAVEVLLEEVTEFHRIADSVAQSGWEPDLNDGIILNAAPLQELFADRKWRTDIEKHRKKMINGDYPWATVQTTYYDRIES